MSVCVEEMCKNNKHNSINLTDYIFMFEGISLLKNVLQNLFVKR